MKKLFIGFMVFGILLISGCTQTDWQRHGLNPGGSYTVEQYSGGKVVGTYTTTNFQSESGTDGYFFIDTVSGKLHMLSGTINMTKN